jgi:putative ABC transport system permease protein
MMKNEQRTTAPPKWPRRILEWYAEPHVVEDLVGDLDEMFWKNLRSMSLMRARLRYCRQAIVLLFSYAVRKRREHVPERAYHAFSMYANYWKVAVRSLMRHRSYSLINMVCLSVGMSVGLLALAAFMDMREVDDFQEKGDRIYRVTTTIDDMMLSSSSAPLAEKLRSEGSGVEEVVQMKKGFDPQVRLGSQLTMPLQGYYATQNFFSVFTFPLLEGNPREALKRPFTVVITRETEQKLFGTASAMGKTIDVEGLGDFEVTGILDEYPRSHFFFEALASFSTIEVLEKGQHKTSLPNWGPVTNYYTYFLLRENSNPEDLNPLLRKMESSRPFEGNAAVSYGVQALMDISMSEPANEIGLSWGYESVIVFFTLAALVLLPACFNYANISIARAMKRSKEIGLRKVSGGDQRHIFYQMTLETVIITLLSLAAALPLYYFISREFVGMVVNGSRSFDLEITLPLFGLFVVFAVFTGILAGVFPAIYFSRISPIDALRGTQRSGKLSKISVRKWLVVAQFALSMVFIMGVVITLKQYRYALNFDLGFQKDNMLTIPLRDASPEILRNHLTALPGVQNVSFASSIPGGRGLSSTWAHQPGLQDSVQVTQMFIDRQYFETMKMQLVAGATFPGNPGLPEKYIVVNETLLQQFHLGTPREALGKVLAIDHDYELRIVGVVKDFNFSPLHDKIESFFFRNDPARFQVASVRLSGPDVTGTLLEIERAWNKVSAEKFEAFFLDNQMKESLQAFLSFVKIFAFLGLVAITVSALGLLAVVISAAETRTREMGIRKVMGATPIQLAGTLSYGFFRLVAIGALLAIPIGYPMFDKVFLSMIYYRTQIEPAEILFSILLLFAMVALVIGSQTLRVARINPVDTLRAE